MIKLTQLLKAWDILHVMDVGEIGLCDLDKALTEAGVVIKNDCSGCCPDASNPIVQADVEIQLPVFESKNYNVEWVDAHTVRLTRIA